MSVSESENVHIKYGNNGNNGNNGNLDFFLNYVRVVVVYRIQETVATTAIDHMVIYWSPSATWNRLTL